MQKKFLYTLLISTSVLSCIGLNSAYAAVAPSNGWYNPQPSQWYYYKNNEPVTGLYTPEKDHTYYFNESSDKLGLMYTGFKKIGDNWYYFDENNTEGSMGSKHTGWLFRSSKRQYYYFDGSGKMITGWLELGPSEKYYFYESGSKLGQMATGTVNINGTNYTFNDDGRLKE